MFARSQQSRLIARLIAMAMLVLAGAITREPARAATISPQAALVRLFTVTPIQASWFAPSFLATISAAQVQQGIQGVEAQVGPYQSVAKTADGSFLVRFKSGTANAQISLDTAGRIDSLGITNLKLTSSGSSTPPSSAHARAATIDVLLQQRTRDHTFSGAVLVAVHGKVLLSKGYGLADAAHGTHNTTDTKFRIGSITKQFTAVAILQLQETGKLSIHDRLCRYIQPCPKAWAPITLRMLLTHTSGLPTNLTAPGARPDITKPITSAQGIDYIKRVQLDRAPGATYEYSNANFDLLGYIVELVARMPYATYVQTHILDPLSLGHSGYDKSHIDAPTHAIGYSAWAVPAPYIDLSWLYAAGALYSTVGDLWHWDQALAGDALLDKTSTADMFAAHAVMCDSAAACGSYDKLAYGYGVVNGVLGGQPIIWHNGALNGFVSMNEMLPKQDITIVVLSNLASSGADGVVGVQFARMMLGLA
jgi:CubicO group peptidase (beta-lactamase class C family)